jgi:hypothetical protein
VKCIACFDAAAISLRFAKVYGGSVGRLPYCERCARGWDDNGAIEPGSAIRLFPKEVKR